MPKPQFFIPLPKPNGRAIKPKFATDAGRVEVRIDPSGGGEVVNVHPKETMSFQFEAPGGNPGSNELTLPPQGKHAFERSIGRPITGLRYSFGLSTAGV